MSRDLLLEIGCEELPAGFIRGALEHMKTRAAEDLRRLRLGGGEAAVYGTPRRLAIVIRDVPERQEDLVKEMKGPSRRVAFAEDGTPTKAAEGFARGQGLSVDALEVRATPQGEYVFAVTREEGAPALDVLARWLPAFVQEIPFPKSMRWGAGAMRFARPVRWLAALFGDDIVPFEVDGVAAGRVSRGHRFLAPDPVVLAQPDEYVAKLRDAFVLVDAAERKAAAARAVERRAEEAGGSIVDDGGLMEEVTNLVEYPAAVTGSFDAEYLSLPRDVLVTPMREHQRYFPLESKEGRLLPRFVAVMNGPRPDDDVVRRGNEKVLAARLADARFFYEEDRKRSLDDMVEELRHVVFQQRLGTVYDKTLRTEKLVDALAADWGVDDPAREAARRGARLAKADLVSHMVGEFPELQGVMGKEYALLAGEDEGAARVVYEHHLPRHAGDDLPQSTAGRLVSVADKIDTIVGCFGAGLIPTGSQDPYGLRRQALGVLRIALDADLPLHLSKTAARAYDLYDAELADRDETLEKVRQFFRQRLRGLLAEEGIRHDVADAAIGVDSEKPSSVVARARALQRFVARPEFDELLTAYERVFNLANQGDGDEVNPALFAAGAEAALYEAVTKGHRRLPSLLGAGAYSDALGLLATMRPAVDKFFDDVMVMAKEEEVRRNRLALLRQTLALFHGVARFDAVVVAGS